MDNCLPLLSYWENRCSLLICSLTTCSSKDGLIFVLSICGPSLIIVSILSINGVELLTCKWVICRYHLDLCANIFGEGTYPEVEITNLYYGGSGIKGRVSFVLSSKYPHSDLQSLGSLLFMWLYINGSSSCWNFPKWNHQLTVQLQISISPMDHRTPGAMLPSRHHLLVVCSPNFCLLTHIRHVVEKLAICSIQGCFCQSRNVEVKKSFDMYRFWRGVLFIDYRSNNWKWIVFVQNRHPQ